jgi:hypothetical protein
MARCNFQYPTNRGPCQFDGVATVGDDTHEWCIIHRPMDDKLREYQSDDYERLASAIRQLAEAAIQDNKPLDLTGVELPAQCGVTLERVPGLVMLRGLVDAPDFLAGCDFSGDVTLQDVSFRNGVDFSAATFRGRAHLYFSPCENECDFSRSVFHDRVVFPEAPPASRMRFDGCHFLRDADFRKLQAKALSMADCKFNGPVSLAAQIGEFFGDNFRCQESAKLRLNCIGSAKMRDASFEKGVSFVGSKFSSIASFDGLVVSETAEFHEVEFGPFSSFYGCKFHGDAIFTGPPSESTNGGKYFQDVTFRGTIFWKRAIFTNRDFRANADFEQCLFAVAPQFHGSRLHQAVVLPHEQAFPDTHSEHAAQAYRTLKLAMETNRARREEAMFYALEQRSLRRRPTEMRWSERLTSSLYDWTSEYGQNFRRPLYFLAATAAVFGLGYALWLSPIYDAHASIDSGLVKRAIGFSIEQIVSPFGVWRNTLTFFNGTTAVPHELRLKLIATCESIMSAAFAALFFLALRWRFKRE